ncbi:MAG TPA: ATP-binding cassette domain-containing protein [Candidatus Dormibacteraeota bacterium]
MAVAAAQNSHILELRHVSKRFGAVQALTDVDFEVATGEVVGLVGDNGAGKSTLIKIIAGTYHADSGDYHFQGKVVTVHGPRDVAALGIATVYQDLALCDNLDVVANLYLGHEEAIGPAGPLSVVDEVPMERRAIEVLRGLAVKIPSVRVPVASLSGGQRQSVAVARSVMGQARVILLDEPTAALGVAQTRQVLDLISRLREQGLAVVVISHNLDDVFEVCDRVVVLRLGKRAASMDLRTSTREQVVAAITGADIDVEAEAAELEATP